LIAQKRRSRRLAPLLLLGRPHVDSLAAVDAPTHGIECRARDDQRRASGCFPHAGSEIREQRRLLRPIGDFAAVASVEITLRRQIFG
jgi:hypothetical protein